MQLEMANVAFIINIWATSKIMRPESKNIWRLPIYLKCLPHVMCYVLCQKHISIPLQFPESISLHYAKTAFGKNFGPTLKAFKRMSVENGSRYQGRLEIKVMVSASSYRKQRTPASLIGCKRKIFGTPRREMLGHDRGRLQHNKHRAWMWRWISQA